MNKIGHAPSSTCIAKVERMGGGGGGGGGESTQYVQNGYVPIAVGL